MEHRRIRDAVPVGTVEDAGLRLHAASLLVAGKLPSVIASSPTPCPSEPRTSAPAHSRSRPARRLPAQRPLPPQRDVFEIVYLIPPTLQSTDHQPHPQTPHQCRCPEPTQNTPLDPQPPVPTALHYVHRVRNFLILTPVSSQGDFEVL